MRTKVKFGAINQPKPEWARWMFRIVALITTVIAAWVAGTALIPESAKMEVVLLLKSIDMLVLGLSNMFGIVNETKK